MTKLHKSASPAPAPISMPTLPDNATVALTNAPPALVESGDVEVHAQQIAEAWVKDRGDAPYQGIARSVARFMLELPSSSALTKPVEGAVGAREYSYPSGNPNEYAIYEAARTRTMNDATQEDYTHHLLHVAFEAGKALSLRPERSNTHEEAEND